MLEAENHSSESKEGERKEKNVISEQLTKRGMGEDKAEARREEGKRIDDRRAKTRKEKSKKRRQCSRDANRCEAAKESEGSEETVYGQ